MHASIYSSNYMNIYNLYAKCVRVVTLMHRDKPKEDPFGSHRHAAAIVLGVYYPKDL